MAIGPVGSSPYPMQPPSSDPFDDPRYKDAVLKGMQAMASQGYQAQKQQREDACKPFTEHKEDDDSDD